MKFKRSISSALLFALVALPASAFGDVTSSTTTTTGGGPGSALPTCVGLLTISKLENSSERVTSEEPLVISQSDCVKNAHLKFTYGYTGDASFHIAAYGLNTSNEGNATQCITADDRNDANCVLVAESTGAGDGGVYSIYAKDIANRLLAHPSCHDSEDGEQIAVTIYIDVIDDNNAANDNCTYTGALSLSGPEPPTDVSAGPGDGSLILTFTSTEDANTVRYNLYCDDGSGESGEGGGNGTGGGAAAKASEGTGGAGGSASVFHGFHPGPQYLGSGGAGGTGGTTTTTTDLGVGGSSGPSCTFSGVLEAGKVPDPKYKVGSADGNQLTANTSNNKKMKNGQEYACAIAAIDVVGNIGPLSNVACGVPEPNDDFFGEYRGDSGMAGGGLCAIGRSSSAFAAMSAGVGLSLLALGARRRSRSRRGRGRA